MNKAIRIDGSNNSRMPSESSASARQLVCSHISRLRFLILTQQSPVSNLRVRVGPFAGQWRTRLPVAAYDNRLSSGFLRHVVYKLITLIRKSGALRLIENEC
jgi:hypothetical protein